MVRLVADDNSGGGSSQRPALQRAGGRRLFTVIGREPSTVPSNSSTASIATAASSVIDSPSKDPMHTTINSRRRVFIRKKAKEEQTIQKIQEMQGHLDRSSVDATNGEYAAQLGEAREIVELVSSLQETNNQKEDTIQHLQQQLSKIESQNESVKAEMYSLKRRHARIERLNYELAEKMAEKALEQLQSHCVTVKAEADDWKGNYEQMGQLCDEHVEQIGGLVEENRQLHVKCQQLEEDEKTHIEELAMMEDMQEENDALHQSMDEAMKLANGMSEKMTSFSQAHEVSVKGYEEKLASLNDKLNQAALPKEECPTALYALKEENEILTTQFKEAGNYFKQDLMELGEVLRAELDRAKEADDYYNRELMELDAEKEAAYQTCKVLQQEIDLLSKALKESELEYDEILYLSDEGSTKENYLADRTKTSDDVGPKGKVPKAAQSTPDNLNEEQTMSSRSAPYIAPKVNGNERSTIQRSIVTNASILSQYGCYDYNGISDCMAIAAEAEREAVARIRKRRYVGKG